MTVTQANAVNTVARYLLVHASPVDGQRVSHDEARRALETLVEPAYRKPYAGVDVDQVRRSWPVGQPPSPEASARAEEVLARLLEDIEHQADRARGNRAEGMAEVLYDLLAVHRPARRP